MTARSEIEVEADDTGIVLYWREEGEINAIFRILVEWIREAEGLSSIETLELRDPEPPGGGGVYLPSVAAREPDQFSALCSSLLRRDFLAKGRLVLNGLDAGYHLVCDGWSAHGLIGIDLPPAKLDQLESVFDRVAGFARRSLRVRLDPTWRRKPGSAT